ncbi:MAG: DUF4276 family protein [Myxococcales bacterium]|nr:DUF4276 family protein [Myxococcales bacterium]
MATDLTAISGWRFVHFGLIVTGKGEREFLNRLLRSLAESGHCTFELITQIGQLSPRMSGNHELKMVGTKRTLPSRDEELGLFARGFLDRRPSGYVLLVDDLEFDRRPKHAEVFGRYRTALDSLLENRAWRAAVFFLVNMLEAYYFAHAAAVNAVLGTSLVDHASDVEDIRHPKNELKKIAPGFDEVLHGRQIAAMLDVPHVLSRPETCGGLRVLFAWCSQVIGEDYGERYRLLDGCQDIVTGRQLLKLATKA